MIPFLYASNIICAMNQKQATVISVSPIDDITGVLSSPRLFNAEPPVSNPIPNNRKATITPFNPSRRIEMPDFMCWGYSCFSNKLVGGGLV